MATQSMSLVFGIYCGSVHRTSQLWLGSGTETEAFQGHTHLLLLPSWLSQQRTPKFVQTTTPQLVQSQELWLANQELNHSSWFLTTHRAVAQTNQDVNVTALCQS